MRAGRWFVAGLWAFGLASALVVLALPVLQTSVIPSLAWPLIAALLADLALRPAIAAGRIEPITMNERALAVIGAALIHTIVVGLAAS
jgi:hypothetical protein